MPRYILVDSLSGHVFADSADFPGGGEFSTPRQFAKAFDASTGERGRGYQWFRDGQPEGADGYHVYRPRPSLDLPIVEDGSTEAEVEEIKRASTYCGFVRVLPAKKPILEPAKAAA